MNRILMGVLGATAAAAAFGQTKLPRGGYSTNSRYNRLYSRSALTTVTGRVVGIQEMPPMNGMVDGVTLLVRQSKKKTTQVELGPAWYVDHQVARIRIGDKVKVAGSRARIGNDVVVLASRVSRGKSVLALRDSSGQPYWDAMRPERFAVSSAAEPITGTIQSENTFTVDNTPMEGVVVETPNGPENVAIAPGWYLRQQEMPFRVGQNITVYSTSPPVRFGNLIVANSIGYGTSVLVLRGSLGAPIWYGWP